MLDLITLEITQNVFSWICGYKLTVRISKQTKRVDVLLLPLKIFFDSAI